MPMGKICRNCNKIISENTKQVYIPIKERTDPNIEYKHVKTKSTIYYLTFCSDKCRKKHWDKKRQTQNINNKMKRSQDLKNKLMDRDKGCIFCQHDKFEDWRNVENNNIEIHRIIPGEKGGKYTLNNTVLACNQHHLILTNKSNSFIKKWVKPKELFARDKINHKFKRLRNGMMKYQKEYIKK